MCGVREIPTMAVFKNGILRARKGGATSFVQLQQFLDQNS
jgi:thioredoxin-like negative regulator of GroEL